MSRPEHAAAPEIFYNEEQAAKYSINSRIISVQSEMSKRAIQLLALPDDKSCFLLDIGCGSGLSGQILTEAGHQWIGIDISKAMLDIAQNGREVSGDLILGDIGNGLPFVPGSFDGAISISAIQWLCHSNSRDENPKKRLLHFFQTLYACLCRGTRAVFQFYPETVEQSELISSYAMRAGFTGGLVIDYPNSTKAKKIRISNYVLLKFFRIYLVLMTGGQQHLPRALTSFNKENNHIPSIERRVFGIKKNKSDLAKGSKAWIKAKKERARKRGKQLYIHATLN
ncbi:unnamed protein product [Dracunculus medinensis]|uniref:Methyltransf_11 domain-containing protein n=1 Tax=Dracunculus medinensis TaxID=318479 RepID=A0A0N4UAC8_DRAME|nr:unnamed protein product [Dracunculus medinensis]